MGVRLNDVPPTEHSDHDRRTDPSLPVNPEAGTILKIRKMGAPASIGNGEPSEAGAEPNPKLDYLNKNGGSAPEVMTADPELAAVCRAWASLPEYTRQAVLLLVRASGK